MARSDSTRAATPAVPSLATAAVTAAALGALAGLRSMMPLALVSRRLVRAGIRPPGPLAPLGVPAVAHSLTAAAVGEVLADKSPLVPARTRPFPLAGRILAGATVAMAAATSQGFVHRPNGTGHPGPGPASTSLWLAALAGAAGALAGSFAGYQLRRSSARTLGLPDPVAAIAEDALCFLASRQLIARLG